MYCASQNGVVIKAGACRHHGVFQQAWLDLVQDLPLGVIQLECLTQWVPLFCLMNRVLYITIARIHLHFYGLVLTLSCLNGEVAQILRMTRRGCNPGQFSPLIGQVDELMNASKLLLSLLHYILFTPIGLSDGCCLRTAFV